MPFCSPKMQYEKHFQNPSNTWLYVSSLQWITRLLLLSTCVKWLLVAIRLSIIIINFSMCCEKKNKTVNYLKPIDIFIVFCCFFCFFCLSCYSLYILNISLFISILGDSAIWVVHKIRNQVTKHQYNQELPIEIM